MEPTAALSPFFFSTLDANQKERMTSDGTYHPPTLFFSNIFKSHLVHMILYSVYFMLGNLVFIKMKRFLIVSKLFVSILSETISLSLIIFKLSFLSKLSNSLEFEKFKKFDIPANHSSDFLSNVFLTWLTGLLVQYFSGWGGLACC